LKSFSLSSYLIPMPVSSTMNSIIPCFAFSINP